MAGGLQFCHFCLLKIFLVGVEFIFVYFSGKEAVILTVQAIIGCPCSTHISTIVKLPLSSALLCYIKSGPQMSAAESTTKTIICQRDEIVKNI